MDITGSHNITDDGENMWAFTGSFSSTFTVANFTLPNISLSLIGIAVCVESFILFMLTLK